MRAEGPGGPSRRLHVLGESEWLTSAKLKLVDGCNLRCFMCDYWRGKREGELDTGEVHRILEELRALECEKVHFTGGELFLRRDAIELMAYATELGMRANLTSNGTLLDRERIRELCSIPVRTLTLSLDSPVSSIHDAVRGIEGAYDKTLRALDRLLATRKKTRIRINTVVSRRNFRSLIEMPALLRDRDIDGWLLIPMDPWTDNQHALSAADVLEYNGHVAPILEETCRVVDPWIYGRSTEDVGFASRGAWARGYYRNHLCRAPWFHVLVDARGDVYPCCMGHTRLPRLGNVREASLAAIFGGEAYVRFRRSMLIQRESICHRCDDFLEENRAFDELEESWT
jgi:radical SAM protein with 4Fe4S-binding SPASM domain